jgi:hypothetical protein
VATFESEREKGVDASEKDNRVFILHTSGSLDKNRPKLESSVIPDSRIYNYKTFQHPFKASDNEKVQFYEQIIDEIIAKGAEQGWTLSVAYDDTDANNKFVLAALWSWDRNLENQLSELLRPAGCCCNIF